MIQGFDNVKTFIKTEIRPRLFLKDQDLKLKTKTKTLNLKTKAKTTFLVLEGSRDQTQSLETTSLHETTLPHTIHHSVTPMRHSVIFLTADQTRSI